VSSLSAGRALIMNDSGNITGSGVSSQVLTARDQSGGHHTGVHRGPASGPDQRLIRQRQAGAAARADPLPDQREQLVRQTSINVPQSATSPHVVSVTDQSGNITITR
jgi:hypothetical protein